MFPSGVLTEIRQASQKVASAAITGTTRPTLSRGRLVGARFERVNVFTVARTVAGVLNVMNEYQPSSCCRKGLFVCLSRGTDGIYFQITKGEREEWHVLHPHYLVALVVDSMISRSIDCPRLA